MNYIFIPCQTIKPFLILRDYALNICDWRKKMACANNESRSRIVSSSLYSILLIPGVGQWPEIKFLLYNALTHTRYCPKLCKQQNILLYFSNFPIKFAAPAGVLGGKNSNEKNFFSNPILCLIFSMRESGVDVPDDGDGHFLLVRTPLSNVSCTNI